MVNKSKKIKVLIVDDSAVIRKALSRIFAETKDIEVVGSAMDPYIARDKIIRLKPDVMTLDIEMPKMDGLSFLAKLMQHHPIPTVIVSSLTTKNSSLALKAFELGAVEVIGKPVIDITKELHESGTKIIDSVRAAHKTNLHPIKSNSSKKNNPVEPIKKLDKTTHQILAIASSTGGIEALTYLMPRLPADIPGTLIAQHMPPVFSKNFSQRLNELCEFEVSEAKGGETVIPGRVLIAPGDFHMTVVRRGGSYVTKLDQRPPVHSVRPSADVLFDSVAEWVGKNAIGLVLTGMGIDGAAGLKNMRSEGSFNIAQSKYSCVVYGMPKEAIEIDAIHTVADLENIPEILISQFNKRKI